MFVTIVNDGEVDTGTVLKPHIDNNGTERILYTTIHTHAHTLTQPPPSRSDLTEKQLARTHTHSHTQPRCRAPLQPLSPSLLFNSMDATLIWGIVRYDMR